MKKAVIFLNGDLTDINLVSKLIKKNDFIIGANGGTKNALKLHLTPNIIIGDIDSLPKSLIDKLTRSKIEFIKHSTEKDKTDSQLAIEIAIEKGYKTIIFCGLLGSRVDHLLANLLLPFKYKNKQIQISIIEGNQLITAINKKALLEVKPGDLVSLLPLSSKVSGITTDGLRFKLTNDTLRFGESRGISNVAIKDKITISVNVGKLLVIHTNKVK